jgi:hypothetical protein
MWQGWHDEHLKNLRLERELKNLTTLFRRVVDERDSLKIERDKLKEELRFRIQILDKVLVVKRDKLEEENNKLRKS